MGQPVSVIEKPTGRAGVLRFETNRNLTGMGHERYYPDKAITGDRPPDVLAKRLFERGGVASIHVYGGVITVELAAPDDSGIKQIIEDLYVYYRPETAGTADAPAAG
ncbi:MAG: hypothetical protein IT196_14940 [Acidimicrobiales bacterium]|nr:hypothetical protein [Acidimicrobiales bacterium]